MTRDTLPVPNDRRRTILVDILYRNFSTAFLFRPVTDRARVWLGANAEFAPETRVTEEWRAVDPEEGFALMKKATEAGLLLSLEWAMSPDIEEIRA